jgi:hypothetical protein
MRRLVFEITVVPRVNKVVVVVVERVLVELVLVEVVVVSVVVPHTAG